jgi:hypothetical protein
VLRAVSLRLLANCPTGACHWQAVRVMMVITILIAKQNYFDSGLYTYSFFAGVHNLILTGHRFSLWQCPMLTEGPGTVGLSHVALKLGN